MITSVTSGDSLNGDGPLPIAKFTLEDCFRLIG